MANAQRGEFGITVPRLIDGKRENREYTLKLSMNVAATYQTKTKRTIADLVAKASELDFVEIRTFAWMLLQKYHADEIKTEEHAGDWLDDAGGVVVFFETLRDLLEKNATPAPEGAAGGNPLEPAGNGIGTSSSSPAVN